MKVYGLIGYPLGHSFSEKYFSEKFSKEKIKDCSYKAFPIQEIDELRAVIENNPGLKGINVTIPYKQLVLPLLYSSTGIPDGIRACNCIKIMDGKTYGYNTDIIGFEQSLLPQLRPQHTHALILGNGGAAAAVKYVLNKLNISFKVVSRKSHDGADLIYDELNEAIIREHLLIINTTPLGTFPNLDQSPFIPYHYLTPAHYLFDLVYNPAKTLFLQKGEEKGAAVKNGYEMLVLQAEESWRIWNENV
jgi:shikimate dehydrogenase